MGDAILQVRLSHSLEAQIRVPTLEVALRRDTNALSRPIRPTHFDAFFHEGLGNSFNTLVPSGGNSSNARLRIAHAWRQDSVHPNTAPSATTVFHPHAMPVNLSIQVAVRTVLLDNKDIQPKLHDSMPFVAVNAS